MITLVAKREITEAFRARSTRILLALSAIAVVVLVVIARIASGSDRSSLVLVVSGGADEQEGATYPAIGDAVGTALEVTSAPDDAAATALVADDEADIAILGVEGGRSLLTEDPVDLESGSALATGRERASAAAASAALIRPCRSSSRRRRACVRRRPRSS